MTKNNGGLTRTNTDFTMRNGYLKILIPEKMPKKMDVKRYHAIFWINLVTTSLDMMGMGWRQLSFTIPKIHVGQV